MKKGANKSFRGFTIIEVALVLAIAGLIFLMVFIALPGLRASQRDAERRENVAMFLESVKNIRLIIGGLCQLVLEILLGIVQKMRLAHKLALGLDSIVTI